MLECGHANTETVAFITGDKKERRESKVLKLYARAKHTEYRIITDPDVNECSNY